MKKSSALRLVFLMACTLVLSAVCNAQATRTWVSGVGDDANPCSRTAPCKTFAGAISKTAAAGEINVLDPGGFGAVTITKSISIEASGVIAGILVSSTQNGIIINAGVNDVVVIRGLTFEGLGTGGSGIRILQAGAVHVENCTINNFGTYGIDLNPAGATQLFVKDSLIRNHAASNAVFGIYSHPQAAGSALVTIDGVRLDRNGLGMRADDNSKVTIRNSAITNSLSKGLIAFSSTGPSVITVESSVISGNVGAGVVSNGAQSTVTLSNVTINGNATGVQSSATGAIVSFGNNRITGNTTNGSPTSTIPQT